MPRPPDAPTPSAGRVYRAAAWAAFAVMRLQRWRFDVRGAEHLPRVGGAVLVHNHTSFWDFLTVGRLPYLEWGRPVRILAKASLFRAPVFGALMRRAGHIPVQRGLGSRAFAGAVTALRAGELVLVLPEETISPAFELLPFKRGAIRMAMAAKVPIIPAVSWGSHRFHTVGRRPRWSWRLPVVVRYGEPLHPRRGDDAEALMIELERRVAALLDEAQHAYLDGMPAGAWWVPARLGGGAPTPQEASRFVQDLRARWSDESGEDRRPR